MPAPDSAAEARAYVRDCGRAGKALGWVLLLATAFLAALLHRSGGGPGIVIAALCASGVLGAGLTLWRWGMRLEDDGATVVSWSGPRVAFFRKRWSLAKVTGVRVDKEVRVTGRGTLVHYLARVTGHGGLGDLYRRRDRDGHAMRTEAEALAKVLRADLRDESGDHPVVREAAFLDEPLVARLRRLGIAPAMPAQAANATARVRRDAGGAMVVEIPAFGFRARLLVPVAVVWATVAVALGLAVAGERSTGGIPWGLLGILLLLTGAPALMLLANVAEVARRRETISVSRAGVEVQVHGLAGSRTWRMPAAAIEEVVAPASLPGLDDATVDVSQVYGIAHPATLVLVRMDRGDLPLGRSLPLGERRWLRDAIVHALAASAVDVDEARTPSGDGPIDHLRLLRRTLAVAVAAGIALALAEVAGLRHRLSLAGDEAGEPAIDYARYELKPGPGSGFLRVYGRGAQASLEGADLRLVVAEVMLVPLHRRVRTEWRDLSASVHRQVDGGWQFVGHAQVRASGPAIAPGTAQAVPGPHAFVVRGAGETCRAARCAFRLHVVGQVGGERPGWEVTDLATLPLDGTR